MFREKKKLLDYESLKGQKIPLLHKDPQWIELFGDSDDKDIIKYRNRLIELEEKEKKSKILFRKLSKEKKKYIKLILKTSDSINNNYKKENIKLLDKYKEKLLNINDKIDEVFFELETIPDLLTEANLNLLNATINEGYNILGEKEEELEETLIQLEKVNKKLSNLIEKKVNNEEWIDETYTFMHRLLGNDLIEKIDSILSR